MEKEQRQSKDEKFVPWSYCIVLAIWMIGFGLAANLAAGQKSPWPLIYTIIIGLSLGVLILTAGIRAARRSS